MNIKTLIISVLLCLPVFAEAAPKNEKTPQEIYIEQFATHIAGLPVAVNIGCHVTRHKTAIL